MKHFSTVTAVFVAVLVISNTVAVKLFSVGPFVFSGAEFIFPISYIFGDILVEVYGYARSRKVIWTAFFVLIAMSLIYWIVGLLPSAPGWENQEAYMKILGLVPRITIASIIAFWAGEFSNSFVLAKMKILTKGKHLWTRTIGSTIVGQSIDTLLFTVIAFYGLIPSSTLLVLGLSSYGLKVCYEAVATPITYKIVNFLKKEEGIDHYDYKTKFNPFRFRGYAE
jgi:queuosine precursor transporter